MRLPSFSLSGHVVVVTGASRGIGKALAIGFSLAGAIVVLAGRDIEALEKTADEIGVRKGRGSCQIMDVSSVASIDAGMAQIAAKFGHIDILVNNAGVEHVRPAIDIDEAHWDKIVDTNLKGAFFCARAAVRHMKKDGGSILNLCSIASEVGIPTAVPYCTSKTGLAGMTRALATEWAPLGIRVNGIGPGYFRTDMTDGFFADEVWESSTLDKIPLRRFGRMEDLMGTAVFLSSPAGGYITGQVIYVDGGLLAAF